MRTNDLQDLLDTVEAVRSQKYPHVPSALVREVVLIEERNPESDDRVLAEIRKAVDAAVADDGEARC